MLRAPVVAVLMVGMVGSAWAATLPSAQGEVQAHEHHERILSLQQDDLVQGSWQHSGDVALELFGPDGKVIRHWADAPAQGGPFGFIASTAGEYRLRVLGQGEYQWQVKSVTAPQTPAQAEPLQGDVIRQWSMRLRAGEPARGFWDYVQRVGSPLVERYSNTHDRVTFVWRGARNEVRLHGGPFSYTDRMHRLGESDIWYITYDLPRDARFAYRMAPDVPYVGPSMARDVLRAALQRDPHNPNALPENSKDLFDGESVLRLTQAPAEVVALEPHRPLEELLDGHGEQLDGVRRGVAPEDGAPEPHLPHLVADEGAPGVGRGGVHERGDPIGALGLEVAVAQPAVVLAAGVDDPLDGLAGDLARTEKTSRASCGSWSSLASSMLLPLPRVATCTLLATSSTLGRGGSDTTALRPSTRVMTVSGVTSIDSIRSWASALSMSTGCSLKICAQASQLRS